MMYNIDITISNKVATQTDNTVIVCGNKDYTVTFQFDSEWDKYAIKTARFVYWANGQAMSEETPFSGNSVNVPALFNTPFVFIGVFAGDLCTSTPAEIKCRPGILDNNPQHENPPEDVYNKLCAMISDLNNGTSVNADLAENDETAPGYVKNRTHWKEDGAVLIDDQTVELTGNAIGSGTVSATVYQPIIPGQIYTVSYNGNKYEGTGQTPPDGASWAVYGDCIVFEDISGTWGMVFISAENGNYTIRDTAGAGTVTISVETPTVVHPLDEEFIPKSIARKKEISDLVSPTVSVKQTSSGHTVTITDVNGEKSFDVLNGEQGPAGPTGPTGATGATGAAGKDGKDGTDGKSAYELAQEAGYTGTQQEWLSSIIGKSAYDVAVENGYEGTVEQWLASLVGKDGNDGKDGKSAYEIAVDNGFEGSEEEWLASLRGASVTPLFANSVEELEESGDTTKVYVLPDGYIYAYMKGGTAYTNQISESIDADGLKMGYLKDSRYNSSDTLVTQTGCGATGFIPVKAGDVIRVKNIIFTTEELNGIPSGAYYCRFYDDTFQAVREFSGYLLTSGITVVSSSYDIDSNGYLQSFILNDAYAYAYMRIAFIYTEDEPIITVNEEIVEESYNWLNTGHAFVPADYEDRINNLEEETAKQETRLKAVEDALGTGGTTAEYETVDSVEEMTDITKQYVLSSTNTLWSYGLVAGEVRQQIFDASNTFKGHMSGTSIISHADTIYVLPLDVSTLPEGIDAYIETEGLYAYDSSKSPEILKVGYSELTSLTVGSTILDTAYCNSTFVSSVVSTDTGIRFLVGEKGGSKISGYDVIKTMLFEIEDTHDASTISAYLIYEGSVYRWYDTEIAPESASDGNYADLLVKVNENASAIDEIDNRVTALETGSNTLTIPTFWEDALNGCISKIKTLQVGRNCITFPFFSDNHQRNGYAGLLIAKVMNECNIPYCFYGGDSISSGYIDSEETMMEQDKAFDTMMSYVPNGRFCREVGNHDGYWNVSSETGDENYYTRDQVYDLFLREESIAQNKHFGDDGTYYFVDDIVSKVRFIVLNTNGIRDESGTIVGSTFDSTQLTWLQNTALSFNESGWAVVFISHQPISNHYHALINNAEEVRTVVADYINGTATNKADVVGWFSGHIHRDRIYTGIATNTTDDTEGDAMGFTQVTITSDHTGIAYDDATKHTVASDDQSHAIDFVTINKTARTVNLTRLGIGSDRSYTY